MIIIGVDPGTRVTGYGVIEVNGATIRAVEYGIIKLDAKAHLSVRLRGIYDQLSTIFTQYQPEAISVEEAFVAKNAQTALKLGHARGVILLAAQQANAQIVEFTPRQIKKAVVGNGNADKDQVEFMVRTILSLPDDPIKDDAFDGLAAALCANNYRGFPQ